MRLFVSYSHKDEHLYEQLTKHLNSLRDAGIISELHTHRVTPGETPQDSTTAKLEEADLVLLLVSSDFLASDYCRGSEVQRALNRHAARQNRTIPIVLRSCDWRTASFGPLQALPRDALPVTSWPTVDAAWHDVERGLRLVVEDIRTRSPDSSAPGQVTQGSLVRHRMYDVFKISGVPTITFVETPYFRRLLLSVSQPGRGVVVEGPSGVGKTSAIRRALDLLSTSEPWRASSPTTLLSARNPADMDKILALPSWHLGTVVIDDVHRLSDQGFTVAVDQLKFLADTDDISRKLILVGIPLTSQSLVDVSFDLATRIDTYRLGRVSDDVVLEMIAKGEQALHVTFDRRADIARAAAGSLNVAQAICFSVAASNHVLQTQPEPVLLVSDIEHAVTEVLDNLALKFDPAIRAFARLGGPDNRTCVELLDHLARAEDGYLSIHDPKLLSPSLRQRARRLLTPEALKNVADDCVDWHAHFYYDPRSRALVIEDPQLGFYLRRVSVARVLRQAGKIDASPRRIVFISYAHADESHLDRLRIHLGPISQRVGVELWDDTRIEPGRRWREELDEAVDSAVAAILLVSADYLASEFVQQEELPRLVAAADYGSLRLVPVLVGPCVLDDNPLDRVQFVNSRSEPIGTIGTAKQDVVWASVAKTITTLLV